MRSRAAAFDLAQAAPPQALPRMRRMADEPLRVEGISDDEAHARGLRDGPNRLPSMGTRSLWRLVLGTLRQPMLLLLLATATLYMLVGERADAIGLALSIGAVALISVYQQRRTERVLVALKDLSSPRCQVRRSGRVQRIASAELVRGDLLLVAEGERLACDAVIVQAHSLLLDESLLSGESAPVLKSAAPAPAGVVVQGSVTAATTLFAGSLVVQGDGVAVVSATGARTALGGIGSELVNLAAGAPRTSHVQLELQQVVKQVAWAAALICVAAGAVYALVQGSWVTGLLVGLTLAMSLIPEEFAVVWTVMMALGAWRLAQHQVLTREPQAIEALGTASTLCVDKTGTLTVNRMALLALALPDTATAAGAQVMLAPDAAAPAAFTGLLSTAAQAGVDEGIEPMDQAIRRLRERSLPTGGTTHLTAQLLQRETVSAEHPWLANLWLDAAAEGSPWWAVKGAPEAVLARCELTQAQRQAALQQAAQMAQRGLRVLAVARAEANAPLQWQGLLGFLDPLRAEVPQAIAQCHAAGIRVVMITGDAPHTALAIARMAGLTDTTEPAPNFSTTAWLSGEQLQALSDAELDAKLPQLTVFARVSPAQKLRIVRALQRSGQVVAMTGDGVNDATALRCADIGVAMGQRGTDVAREAASLVLLDDSFSALVAAVRMGRRIFINLQKSVGYLLAVHVPIVALSLIPLLLGGPLLLMPLHVLFLELIIDPACSLVFEAEPEPAGCMHTPPRPAAVGLISRSTVLRALGVGTGGALVVMALMAMARWAPMSAPMSAEWSRVLALSAVIVVNIAMLVGFRRGTLRWRRAPRRAANRSFWWLLSALAVAYGAVLAVPLFAHAFAFPVALPLQAAGLVLIGSGVLIALALLMLQRRRAAPSP
jgi:P-type Ca2+ transporter type 2C